MNKCPVQTQDWETLAREASFHPEAIAVLCQISLRQLERRFKKDFNKTPIQWCRELRRRIAIQHLGEGWTTKAVAEHLRFSDAAHLCHEFKTVYGATPQNFAPPSPSRPKRAA